jgi:hypothetical protein
MIDKHLKDDLEWEVVADETITNIEFENKLYNLSKDCLITFARDDQYRLFAGISGRASHTDDLKPNVDVEDGQFIEGETINAFSNHGVYQYTFTGTYLGTSNARLNPLEDTPVTFHAQLIVHSIERKDISFESIEIERIQEWFLSGKQPFFFPRATDRGLQKKFKRNRHGIDSSNDFIYGETSGTARDYLFVEGKDFSFIVSQVPTSFGPEWSSSLAIEYRKSFGRIPNEEERVGVSELVGFVFGNQLLKIGHSEYDSMFQLRGRYYQNPWGDNIINKCRNKALPPVNLRRSDDWRKVETILQELLPAYMLNRSTMQLKDILWKFWIAKDSPIGTNLPILSSALETLADNYIKSRTDVSHEYIPYKDFNKIIADEITSIEIKIKDYPFKDKILNKIRGAAQRGANQKLDMFFDLLRLTIGGTERKALLARNKMAHSQQFKDDEIEEIIRLTRAYQSLFHRVFLKILGYNGDYVDYYTDGFPSRNLNEPIP